MEIHHFNPFFRGIDWDLSLLFVPGKLMNIVLDVAQGVLGDFSDLLFFTEFFGGVPELFYWDPNSWMRHGQSENTMDDLWVPPNLENLHV